MPKKSNVFARVEPELKEQAEMVLNLIGLPMSIAITLFLRQVVINRGIPFPIVLPSKPKGLEEYTKEEFDEMIRRSIADYDAGRYSPAEEFFEELIQDHVQRYGE